MRPKKQGKYRVYKGDDEEDKPSGIRRSLSSLGPISTPKIPLMMASAATVFVSPPRFLVAGIARARVRERAAKERERGGEMPMR